jgi:hypothetical protein
MAAKPRQLQPVIPAGGRTMRNRVLVATLLAATLGSACVNTSVVENGTEAELGAVTGGAVPDTDT